MALDVMARFCTAVTFLCFKLSERLREPVLHLEERRALLFVGAKFKRISSALAAEWVVEIENGHCLVVLDGLLL